MLSIRSSCNVKAFKDFLHFDLDVIVMDVYLGSVWAFGSSFAFAGACEKGMQDLVAEDDKGCHGAQAVEGSLVTARIAGAGDQSLPSKLFQVVGGVARLVNRMRRSGDFSHLLSHVGCGKSSGVRRQANDCFHRGPDSGPINVDTADATGADLGGEMPRFHGSQINKRNIHGMQDSEESLQHRLQQLDNARKLVNGSATRQVPGIMSNGFDSEDAFAFAINLEGQVSEMHLKNRQIIDRSLDRHLKTKPLAVPVFPVGTVLVAKDGFHRFYVERAPRPVNESLEYLVHGVPAGEEEIPAVLCLVNRVGVAESGLLLLLSIQGKAQTCRVDPTFADLGQTPCRVRRSHGICDLGQVCGIGHFGKAVFFFGETYPTLAGLNGYMFMPVQYNLSVERGMRA